MKSQKNKLIVLSIALGVLLFICYFLFMPNIYHGDQGFWKNWASRIKTKGLGSIYDFKMFGRMPVNYPPIWLYCLAIFGYFQESVKEIATNLNSLKTIPLLFDFIQAYAVFLLLPFRKEYFFLPFFLLFNIGFVYNSIFWGQCDSIYTCFALLAIVAAIHRRISWSMICFILAINMKFQAIVFLPLLGLLWLPMFFNSVKKMAWAIGWALLVQVFLLLPFYLAGTLPKFWETVTSAVGFYPKVSMKAFNLWYLIFGEACKEVSDQIRFWGLSYKVWGLGLFMGASGLALLTVLKEVWLKKLPVLKDDVFRQKIFLVATIISINFFFFNTQMHERYFHPAMIFAFFFGILSGQYRLFIFCTLTGFLHLESKLKAFEQAAIFEHLFNPYLNAVSWLLTLIYGAYLLWKLQVTPQASRIEVS